MKNGASVRVERLLKREKREKTLLGSLIFRFFSRAVKFHISQEEEKREGKKKSNFSPFDFSLVDRFDTNNNFNNNNNNNNNKKKKKKKKTKEIDNKYTEYS